MQTQRIDALREHPAAAAVPKMRPDEWTAFLADVNRRGIQEPIVVCKGVVLDGRHRLEAAELMGQETISAREVDVPKADQPGFVISAALLRRQLSDGQRAILGGRLKETLKPEAAERKREGQKSGGRGKKKNSPANLRESKQRESSSQAAALVGTSPRTVDAGSKVVKSGSAKLVEAVEAGAVAVSVAAQLADLPKREQDEALAGGKAAIRAATRKLDGYRNGKSPQEEARDDPGHQWHKAKHSLYVLLNSVRDNGGIRKLAEKWSAESRQKNRAELQRIVAELEKWVSILEDQK